jgi:hypothetical protein
MPSSAAALAAWASSRSLAIFDARSSNTDATNGRPLRESRMYSTPKMIAPHITWLMVSGVVKSSCGMPLAIAAQGSSKPAARAGTTAVSGYSFIVLIGLMVMIGRTPLSEVRPPLSDKEDDEGDHQRIQRHGFR